jgi:N-acetylmuramoyl-L-alanine amidase
MQTTNIYYRVFNRGVPPKDFITRLVAWAATAPDEIFSPEYKSTKEKDIYQFYSEYMAKTGDDTLYLGTTAIRAIMCEVLRVLGGFESSWRWSEGVDTTNPSSNTPCTAEAGVFQCSGNSMNFHPSLKECFVRYWKAPGALGGTPDGVCRRFQDLMKQSHTFAFEYTARLLRFTIRHHGPLLRGEVFEHMNPDAISEFKVLIENHSVKPEPNTTPMKPASPITNRYIIDPGHGGHDSGAVGVGLTEKEVVLDVSKKLQALMTADSRFPITTMTRTLDGFVTLAGRAALANTQEAILISIHANSSTSNGRGFECFTSPGQTESDKIATAVLEAYADEFQHDGIPGRYDTRDGDKDKEARFTVLTATKKPAILFELAFIDNPLDHALLANTKVRERMARALYTGICHYEGVIPLDRIPATPPAPVLPVGPPNDPIGVPGEVGPVGMDEAQIAEGFFICAKWLEDGAKALEGTIIENTDSKDWTKVAESVEMKLSFEGVAELLIDRAEELRGN